MPEGPEVATEANILHQFLSGKQIIGIGYDKESKYHSKKKMDGLTVDILPITVNKVYSHGKLIIIDSNSKDGKVIYLVSHLMLTGYWTFERKKHSNLWIKIGEEDKIEKCHYKETGRIFFNDTMKLGTFGIYNNLNEQFKKNGPCMFSAAMLHYENRPCITKAATREIWKKCLSNKRIASKPICEFMLEQKYLCGIGNYLRCEILYSAEINPERELQSLTEEEKDKMYDIALDMIYRSFHSNLELSCYGRSTDPSGNEVVQYKDAKNRTMHYVPLVQK